MIRSILLCGSLMLLTACANHLPPTIVSQPTSWHPATVQTAAAANGSIFQAGSARMLLEDPTARRAGDIVTIRIQEQVTASTTSASKADRSAENKIELGTNSNFFDKLLGGLGLDIKASSKHDGSGTANSRNSFTGDISAQVVDVLANGNLVIAGEKQVNIRGEVSYLRISGIVSPADITTGNVVLSTKVAEARIEEVGSGTVATATNAGWLQRFFFSVLPF
ncbi:flagellar basal body L-ring protein FlgH [Chitinimonas sp. BJB300]|uniref:flagellar basal body L-ring protein FlgH n=1 Tax=Chitinimonas sp. BJB300 TaxID=1559339 RepID=UPI000C11019C|nr:flagellar basal body L-ring protein FlgH [Chitinimonas sp. BJB300]PHV11238.1 flagellar biosynthesis protein FlgH [Chitinimonas sp. BJB300]TSJ88616.1 flagellar basal body L-ring protein FlgH [Chitinimonas sp. BJB300]